MDTNTKRKYLIYFWSGCGIACSWISLLFKNAGMISFSLAVVGTIALITSCIYEVVLAKKRSAERDC